MTTMAMTSTSDIVREYVRSERRKQRITQQEMADHMGVALRTYTEWERGRTKTIKDQLLKRALSLLQISAQEIGRLLSGGASTPPPDPRQAFRELAETLTDDELSEVIAAIQRLRASRRQRKKPRASRNDDA